MTTDCHYITKYSIIPIAVLCTPIVILLPSAVLYQLLYYKHRSLLHPLLLYYEITYIICEIFPLLLYYEHLLLLHPLLLYYTKCCIISTDRYCIPYCCIIPTAMLQTPVVTASPIAVFPLLLYYQHSQYFVGIFLRYSANMGENLGIAERFLISIIVV